MTTAASDPGLAQWVPQNLAPNAVFCEEVFVNQAEVAYITEPAKSFTLRTLAQQAAYLKAGHQINSRRSGRDQVGLGAGCFAPNSPAAFTCPSTSSSIYTEKIDGTCYALAGIHISSKLYPNWLWATFEPQFAPTNPNRCNPTLYSSCSDSWGSDPAASTGSSTKLTPALAALMQAAKLPAAFQNYRLVGTQTDFVDKNTTLLGNSFTEFNAGVSALQASCITCHSYARLNVAPAQPVENPNFGAFPNTPATGNPSFTQPPLPPSDWQSQDFSWLLGIMPTGQ